MGYKFKDIIGISLPFDYEVPTLEELQATPGIPFPYELPSPEDIERMEKAEIARKQSEMENWLLLWDFLVEYTDDEESSDIMVYDPVEDREVPLYFIERRTLRNLRRMNHEICKGAADRYANILEYCDWHLSSELRSVTARALYNLEAGILDGYDDKFVADFCASCRKNEGPDEDFEFELACIEVAWEYMLNAYTWFYEKEVLGVTPHVDYTPSPYRPGGNGYRLK